MKGHDLLLVPDVIAGGDNGNAGAQKIDRDLRRNSASAGGVLAIDDDEIDRVLLLQLRAAAR